MALTVGSRLGHYDVTALIGEGGMGQVYQATDTKLNRQVALKILPEAFATDPDRLARFQREAQVLASLNHPGIAAIYGLEESEGTRALVLELVEGPTLADRIAQGAIPVDEALPIAKQIAEALEAAHEAGVIHRDLKPANIKVKDDGTVKVLDFGLAKALDTTPEGDPSQSPTLTAAATQMGVIMGTAAYMSPEQASGETTDKRSDIWSFGVVVLEMVTGHRLFEGKTVSHVLASVLKTDPDWRVLPSTTPESLVWLLRRCLEKEPRRRLRDIGEAVIQLEEAVVEPAINSSIPDVAASGSPGWRQIGPLAVGALIVGGLIAGLAVWSVTQPASPRVVRLGVPMQGEEAWRGNSLDPSLAISPDGTRLVYVGAGQLFARPLDQPRPIPLSGPDAPRGLFFSPDGEWVGYFDPPLRSLMKVASTGGPPVTVVSGLTAAARGASWGPDDQIIFATNDPSTGLLRVPAAGGEPEVLTVPNPEQEERDHLWPELLPGGSAVLFTIAASDAIDTWKLLLSTFERMSRSFSSRVAATHVTCRRAILSTGRPVRCARWPSTSTVSKWWERPFRCSRM